MRGINRAIEIDSIQTKTASAGYKNQEVIPIMKNIATDKSENFIFMETALPCPAREYKEYKI
jgi:hypothetical protein